MTSLKQQISLIPFSIENRDILSSKSPKMSIAAIAGLSGFTHDNEVTHRRRNQQQDVKMIYRKLYFRCTVAMETHNDVTVSSAVLLAKGKHR